MRLRPGELGAANREKPLGAEPHDVKPGPISVTMANREIDLLAREVDVMHRRRHPQIDVGMGLGKPAEPMHQPFGGKIRRRADGQNAGGLALDEALGAHRDPVQCIADHREIFAAGLGHHQPLALAIEKLDAKRRLKRLDLMAHRPLRDAQLFRRSGEALAPRRGLEGLQRIQRRQAAEHRSTFMRKTKAA